MRGRLITWANHRSRRQSDPSIRPLGGIQVLAPVITDGPLLMLAMYLAGLAQGFEMVTGVISLIGCGVLTWLAYDTGQAAQIQAEVDDAAPGSIGKAVLTNLANPHPYVFWVTIGAPTALEAINISLSTLLVFVECFCSVHRWCRSESHTVSTAIGNSSPEQPIAEPCDACLPYTLILAGQFGCKVGSLRSWPNPVKYRDEPLTSSHAFHSGTSLRRLNWQDN